MQYNEIIINSPFSFSSILVVVNHWLLRQRRSSSRKHNKYAKNRGYCTDSTGAYTIFGNRLVLYNKLKTATLFKL